MANVRRRTRLKVFKIEWILHKRNSSEKIDGVKDSLAQSTVRALGLYIGLAGALLLVIAHGFKWL